MGPTERMARFIVETRFEALPAPVVTAAKTAILDTVGVALAAVPEPVGRKIVDYVRGMGAAPRATVLGTGLRTAPPWAALANGTLGHALDFDDSNWALHGHGSVTVLPAVLAGGESTGASGREVVAAFVVGFEVASKLGAGMNMGLYYNGWHPTSALGAIGAAAASARLLKLDAEQTRLALGSAASQASGVRANFGTMTKPLHAGLSAEAGVRAADLAAAGLTANREILEAPSGFCEAFSGAGNYRMEEVIEGLGRPYVLEKPGDNLKPYPCCMSAHTSIDALRDLMAEEGFSAADVERIDVDLMKPNLLNLSHHRPRTGLEGKFSGEYTLSRFLLGGGLRLSDFTDEAVNEPAVRAVMERVHLRLSDETFPEGGASRPATLTVRTRDGRELRKRTVHSRGHAGRPLSREEIHAKFRDCAGVSLDAAKVEEAIERLERLEEEPDIRSLIALLA